MVLMCSPFMRQLFKPSFEMLGNATFKSSFGASKVNRKDG